MTLLGEEQVGGTSARLEEEQTNRSGRGCKVGGRKNEGEED